MKKVVNSNVHPRDLPLLPMEDQQETPGNIQAKGSLQK